MDRGDPGCQRRSATRGRRRWRKRRKEEEEDAKVSPQAKKAEVKGVTDGPSPYPLDVWARVRIRLCPGREEEEEEEVEEEEEEEREGGKKGGKWKKNRGASETKTEKRAARVGKEKKTERTGGRPNEPSPSPSSWPRPAPLGL